MAQTIKQFAERMENDPTYGTDPDNKPDEDSNGEFAGPARSGGSMTRFFGTALWAEMLKVGKRAGPKRIAIAYCSADSHLRFGKGDEIIVDASTKAIKTRQTSPEVLLAAARRGALVYSNEKLHAKIILAGNCAIVGSANLSTTSRGLREAGVLIADRQPLREIAQYLDWLRKESRLLEEADIRKLCAIPRPPRGPGTDAKPSLLEAIELERPWLDDVSFNLYSGDAELTTVAVTRAAKRAGVYLPQGNEWIWMESPNTPGALSKIQKLCRARPMVAWEVTKGSTGIAAFKAHDRQAVAFIDAFTLGKHVISIIGERPFVTPFDLRRDRKKLAEVLSAGLQHAPRPVRDAVNDDVGVISTEHLLKIYRLGLKATAG